MVTSSSPRHRSTAPCSHVGLHDPTYYRNELQVRRVARPDKRQRSACTSGAPELKWCFSTFLRICCSSSLCLFVWSSLYDATPRLVLNLRVSTTNSYLKRRTLRLRRPHLVSTADARYRHPLSLAGSSCSYRRVMPFVTMLDATLSQ